jgi:hypothetical protein
MVAKHNDRNEYPYHNVVQNTVMTAMSRRTVIAVRGRRRRKRKNYNILKSRLLDNASHPEKIPDITGP